MAVPIVQDGDTRFAKGMDSVSDPFTLGPESYVYSLNMLNRGGAMKSRPGHRVVLTLPDGVPQGLKVFHPRKGNPVMLPIIAGKVYVTKKPFTDYTQVAGAELYAKSEQVWHAMTTQSVERNPDDSLKLITPRKLLFLQDGVSPPLYYDGHVLTAVTGPNKTPQGTVMAFAGSRLWVANGERLYAGDIGDPTTFLEQTVNQLGGISYYILPDSITAMAPLPGAASQTKNPLVCYTRTSTSLFRANILNRNLWPTIEDFQSDIFPNIGCVSDRSVVNHSGMLWWFSDFGTVRLDSAHNSNVSGRMDYVDREMTRSSSNLNEDLSKVASTHFENFMLTSVPHASLKNEHTWVYDSNTNDRLNEEFPSAWASIWTGINPVEYASVKVNGRTRLFCLSADDDGKNRLYELFTDDRRDNGCDFPWAMESRAYTGGNASPKELRFLEYALSELAGEVHLKFSWAGASRGRWKPFSKPIFHAVEGNVVATQEYGAEDGAASGSGSGSSSASGSGDMLFAFKTQSRLARTQDVRDMNEDDLTSAGVEGQVYQVEAEKEAIDSAFQFRVDGSGPCAIRMLRMFADMASDPDTGMQENPEVADHFVRFDGAASKDEADLDEAPETWTATKTVRAQIGNYGANGVGTVISSISQLDADKRATQVAAAKAEANVAAVVPDYVGGSLV